MGVLPPTRYEHLSLGRTRRHLSSRRIVSPHHLVSLLVWLLTLQRRIWARPQRVVRRLHSLPYYPNQVVAQCVEVRLISELGGESLQRLGRIVLSAVETSIYEALDTVP